MCVAPMPVRGTVTVPLIRLLLRDKRGVTALEYGLIASLIAVAVILAVSELGSDLPSVFARLSGSL